MGSLIRTTAEGVVDAGGQPVFDIVAQIGFDLSELESAPAADVIIDFSNVAAFGAVVAYVERTGAALVSGTTGYTPEQMDRLRELGQNTRVMHSGNYSIGIAALRHLVAQATREVWSRDKAVEFFKSIGEHYKAELIAAIPQGEDASLYREGDFIDLCRVLGVPETGVPGPETVAAIRRRGIPSGLLVVRVGDPIAKSFW